MVVVFASLQDKKRSGCKRLCHPRSSGAVSGLIVLPNWENPKLRGFDNGFYP